MTTAHRAHLVRTLQTTKINTNHTSGSGGGSGATIGKDGAVGTGGASAHPRGTGSGGAAAITAVCVVPGATYLMVVSADGSGTRGVCRWVSVYMVGYVGTNLGS